MARLKTRIEPSQGSIIDNPGEQEILSVLNKFGGGVEHCNFTYGDSFVSAYGSSPEKIYLMFIGRDGTEYNSEPVDASTACKVFMDSGDGDTGWKEKYGFEAGSESSGQPYKADAEAGPGSGGAADPVTGEAGENSMGKSKKSLKEEMLDAVKSEAGYNAKRFVRRGIRGLFGKRF
ncbi:MAG: hypothetical protein R6V67_08910 [Spirochaetia bacterium]